MTNISSFAVIAMTQRSNHRTEYDHLFCYANKQIVRYLKLTATAPARCHL
jgi:hypothetical protein